MAIQLLSIFAQASVDTTPLPQTAATGSEITKVLDIVFTITGAIALLIITLAGFRYITSRGEPQAISQAKDAIIYACVGLILSILAYTIVNFVIGRT